MIQLILQLLIALGISFGSGSNSSIQVINQATGESYSIGTTIGVGSRPPIPTEVFYLMRDENGNYYLVRR